jgi:hypothetical protein
VHGRCSSFQVFRRFDVGVADDEIGQGVYRLWMIATSAPAKFALMTAVPTAPL